MNDRSFEARFQEIADLERAKEQKFSGLKVGLIQAFSIAVGFLFVSVLFASGVKLVSIGVNYPMDTFHVLLTGAGLAILQVAHTAITWARK